MDVSESLVLPILSVSFVQVRCHVCIVICQDNYIYEVANWHESGCFFVAALLQYARDLSSW